MCIFITQQAYLYNQEHNIGAPQVPHSGRLLPRPCNLDVLEQPLSCHFLIHIGFVSNEIRDHGFVPLHMVKWCIISPKWSTWCFQKEGVNLSQVGQLFTNNISIGKYLIMDFWRGFCKPRVLLWNFYGRIFSCITWIYNRSMIGTCLKVLYVNTCDALDVSLSSLMMMWLLNKLILEFSMTHSIAYKGMPHKKHDHTTWWI